MKRKLRIAWLTNCPSGHQIDFLRMLATLEEIDLTVLYCSSIWTKGDIGAEEPFGRGVLLWGMGFSAPGGTVFVNPGIVGHMLSKRYDIMVIGGYVHPTMILAMIVRSICNVPWIFFGERPGMNRGSLASRLIRMSLQFLLKKASAIIATGTLAQHAYQACCGPRILVCSIPYLVDLDPFLQLERPAASKRSARFLFCGQLIHRKGVDTLITAFVRLATEYPETELYIVGDGPEKENLKRSIPAYLKERIVFKGIVPFESRNSSFQEGDIFVHPARHDGWGVVVQEAMAAGLPVIGTKETGAAFDLVVDGNNGFLVDANDHFMLYQRMKWFLDHPNELSVFGQRARERASYYTPTWGADRFLEVTKGILNVSVGT